MILISTDVVANSNYFPLLKRASPKEKKRVMNMWITKFALFSALVADSDIFERSYRYAEFMPQRRSSDHCTVPCQK